MVTEIRLFGALRKFGSNGVLEVEIATPCSVAQIRERVKETLAERHPVVFQSTLIDRAAVADATRVLAHDETVNGSAQLSLLPPVCGG